MVFKKSKLTYFQIYSKLISGEMSSEVVHPSSHGFHSKGWMEFTYT